MTAPSPAQLRAFLDHIETAGIRDRRKMERAVIAGWKAAMEIETTKETSK